MTNPIQHAAGDPPDADSLDHLPDDVPETDGARTLPVAIPAEAAGQRLDRALAMALAEAAPDLSRTRLQVLIREGLLVLGGKVAANPSEKVTGAMEGTLGVPAPIAAEPGGQAIPLTIVHEDDALIVIDKPAGLVVHPAAGHADGTLVNALIGHCGDSLSGIGGVRRPGIVHRLDKDTSGLLVVAKSDSAHQALAAQFADHGRTGPLERAYLALVWGVPERPRGTIQTWIDRDPRNREKMAVAPEGRGRIAITHWEVLDAFSDIEDAPVAGLVRCTLETGRTHQIRVHMAHLGHPLLGDATYGAGFRTKANRLAPEAAGALARLGRQALHAALLGFAHPVSGATIRLESLPPADMQALIASLRGN